jgi:cyanophycinase
MGFLLLEGGREFKIGMKPADERAMAVGRGRTARIRIIPAAAAPDDNDRRAGANGAAWFQALGGRDVRTLPIINRVSADQPELAEELEAAGLIFMLGGFTRYLAETLGYSRAWEAMKTAHRAGAVIAGSSAGAMVLCEHYYDQAFGQVMPGLNLLPGCSVMPHHDTFGRNWAPRLKQLLPDTLLLGIDEETGLLNDGPAGKWTVYGKGTATVYEPGGKTVFHHGQQFLLPIAVKDLP